MKILRAFPFGPTPEPSSLTEFVEETGTNSFLIEAVKALYVIPNKPENPIEWFRLYFNSHYEETFGVQEEAGEDAGAPATPESEEYFKTELLQLESKLLNAFEVEAQNKAIIAKLENELQSSKAGPTKVLPHPHEEFRKYRNLPEDYHYRIRPHPSYQPSVSDMLLSDDGDWRATPETPERGRLKSGTGSMERLKDEEDYADYPQLYFPNGSVRKLVHRPVTAIELDSEGTDEEASLREYLQESSESGYEAQE